MRIEDIIEIIRTNVSHENVPEMLEALDEMREDLKVLNALRAGGVDNWSGYDFAMEELWNQDIENNN